MAALLERSNLSATDRQIAVKVIAWSMPYADIAASLGTEEDPVYLDRSTVGWRMRHIIAPRLEWLMANHKKSVGA